MKNLVSVLNLVVLVLGFVALGVWYYKCFRFWIKAPLDRKIIRMRHNFRSKRTNFSVLEGVGLWIVMNPITDKFIFLKEQIGIKTTNLQLVFKDGKKKNIVFGIDFEFDSTNRVVTDFKSMERHFKFSLLHSLPVEIYNAEMCLETVKNNIDGTIREYCASIMLEEFDSIHIEEMVSIHYSVTGISMKVVNMSIYG